MTQPTHISMFPPTVCGLFLSFHVSFHIFLHIPSQVGLRWQIPFHFPALSQHLPLAAPPVRLQAFPELTRRGAPVGPRITIVSRPTNTSGTTVSFTILLLGPGALHRFWSGSCCCVFARTTPFAAYRLPWLRRILPCLIPFNFRYLVIHSTAVLLHGSFPICSSVGGFSISSHH